MLWKEWRENIKWAVLAMIGLGLAEFYGLSQQGSSYEDQWATLCKSAFLMSTTFGCAAVGVVLGLLQILPEQRRDQWAALLHRPVKRSTIFFGKAFAGIALYFLATVPPYVACVWYVAASEHFAVPFVPQMVFPGVTDICAGAIYYFAALFVGLRRGLWFGSRAFGFLAAIHVSFYITGWGITLFRVPVEASLLMALALFTAGWGAISTNGTMSNQPWLARWALLAVIFYGVSALGEMSNVVLGMFSTPQYYYGTEYAMDIDGRPLKISVSKTAGTTITDLAGNVIKDERFASSSRYNFLVNFVQTSTYIGDPHQLKKESTGYSQGYRSNMTYVVLAGGSYDTETERWYYLPQQRQFVGYFYKTNQRIGSIGQDGFRPGYGQVESFKNDIAGFYYEVSSIFQSGSTVYRGTYDQRKLTPIFSQPGTEVFGATPLQSNQDQTIGLNLGAVVLLDKILIIDKTGQIVATLPYHQDMNQWGRVLVAIKPSKDRFFLHYMPSAWIKAQEQEQMPSYMEEMDAKGTLLNTYTLPPVHQQGYPRTWQQYISEGLETPAFYFGDLIYGKMGALCGSQRLADAYNYRMTDGWGWTKDLAIRTSTFSAIFAVVALIWARWTRFSWKRSWAWALFVLLFNLAGLITFRLVADWPIFVPCPKCQRKRSIQESTCPSCHAGWPAPKREGTEIFDQGSKHMEAPEAVLASK